MGGGYHLHLCRLHINLEDRPKPIFSKYLEISVNSEKSVNISKYSVNILKSLDVKTSVSILRLFLYMMKKWYICIVRKSNINNSGIY